MPNYIFDAIEIITDNGLGIPVTYSNSAIGLASDGHFALINGRPGLDGTKTITGDTTRGVWYPNIMAADPASCKPGSFADFVDAGCFEEVGDMTFAIKNTALFHQVCKDNGVSLGRCMVIYYRVRSSDLLTFNFKRRWSGVIDDQPFNKMTYQIQCVSNSLATFKQAPPLAVNRSANPDAPDVSLEKMIPITMGRVAHSPLVAVSKPGKKVVLVSNGGKNFTSAGLTFYDAATKQTDLYTKGKSFADNDSQLVGSMLTVIAGGESQSVRIVSNTATNTTTERTRVTLEEPFTITSPAVFVRWQTGITDSTMWFAEVQSLTATLIASNKPIYGFATNTFGRAALSSYSNEAGKYRDISDISRLASATNIKSTGFPGVDVYAKNLDIDGEASAYFKIKAASISTLGILPGADYSGGTGDQPNLYDGDPTTYYTVSNTTIGGAAIVFDVEIPQSAIDQEFKDLFLLMDMRHSRASGGAVGPVAITYQVQSQDVYGQNTAVVATVFQNVGGFVSSTPSDNFAIHGTYYNSENTPVGFYTLKGAASLAAVLDNIRKSRAFPKVSVTLQFAGVPSNYIGDLIEIAFIGQRSINVNNDQGYCALYGEKYGTTWDGRRDPALPLQLFSDGMEHLIRNYDTNAPVWVAGKAYVVGETVRGTADTGHIFVCTVAGTSHASTEPSWTDTVGASYTDGSVTWRELREIPINTASFDTVAFQRLGWYFGRTLSEKRESFDWYKEMCQQGFLIGLFDKNGLVKIKSWLQNTTPLVTFTSGAGGNIIRGSFNDMPSSDPRRVYNDILVRYEYDPGSGKFNKQIFITNIDRPAFPSETEPLTEGAPLGAFTASYTILDFGLVQGITIVCSAAHGRKTGDYVGLKGNTDGYDFTLKQISVVDPTTFVIFDSGHSFSATSSTSGALKYFDTNALKWKSYVGGIQNYAVAKDLWDKCNQSFRVTKVINKLPQEMGDCKWFIDPGATDANGDRLWTDLPDNDDHAAVFYTQYLVGWNPWPKAQPTLEVEDAPAFEDLEVGDPVAVLEPKLTNGVAVLGWIHERKQLGGDGPDDPARFRFGVTLDPDLAPVEIGIIDEMGATDIIDEMTATDIIEEVGT